jgi:hypothetical protein
LKKNKVEQLTLHQFKTYYEAIVIKTVWNWHEDRHRDQRNRIKNLDINSYIYGHLLFNKGSNTIQELTFSQAQWLTPVFPATGEAKIGKVVVQGHLSKKLARPPFQRTSWVLWHMPQEALIGLQPRQAQAKAQDPIPKIIKQKGMEHGLNGRVLA